MTTDASTLPPFSMQWAEERYAVAVAETTGRSVAISRAEDQSHPSQDGAA